MVGQYLKPIRKKASWMNVMTSYEPKVSWCDSIGYRKVGRSYQILLANTCLRDHPKTSGLMSPVRLTITKATPSTR